MSEILIRLRKFAGGVLALSVFGLLIGCSGRQSASNQPATVDVVAAFPLRKPIVEWDEYVGRLEPVEFVEVRARVGGYLDEIHFTEGQIVKAGDLLCVIDRKPFAAEVSRAKAELEAVRAALKESEAKLAQANAELKQSESRQSLAHKRLERVRALSAKNAISQDDVDISESEAAQADADIEAAKSRVESAKAGIATSTASIETAKASLAIAELNLTYTEVRAPVAGRVSRHAVTQGNLVSGGSLDATLLTTIVSLDPIHCVFDADEQSFLKYTRLNLEGKRRSSRDVKNPIFLALADEKNGYPHTGHMDFVDNRLDPNTGTMRGRAILANPDGTLTPGLFARIQLPGSGRYEATLIPDSAIGTDLAEKYVLIVTDDGKTKRQVVTIGGMSHGLRIVRSGLDGKEKIVLRGVQRIRPGIQVTAKMEEIKPRTEGVLPDDYEPVPKEQWLSRASSKPLPAPAPTPAPTTPTDGNVGGTKTE